MVMLSEWESSVEDSWPGDMGQDTSGSWGPTRKGPDKEDLRLIPKRTPGVICGKTHLCTSEYLPSQDSD